MLRKLWRRLRRKKLGMRMQGKPGQGKTLTIGGTPGTGQLVPPPEVWFPRLLRAMAERAALRGYKPVIFVDELEEFQLPPKDNAPQK